jgi:hypothetical protein
MAAVGFVLRKIQNFSSRECVYGRKLRDLTCCVKYTVELWDDVRTDRQSRYLLHVGGLECAKAYSTGIVPSFQSLVFSLLLCKMYTLFVYFIYCVGVGYL